MRDLTVLIIGQGAREHAISDAYEKSPHVKKIVVAPGKDFISFRRKIEVVVDKKCSLTYPDSILDVAKRHIPNTNKPHLIDVAQDDALACGVVDLLQKNGFNVSGPIMHAAEIESNKKWARLFMEKYDIPCPRFKSFNSRIDAKFHAIHLFKENPNKVVYVKASGLCRGLGALRAKGLEQTLERIEQMKDFKKAGRIFLIEDALEGEEFSYFAITDGKNYKNYKTFKSARDYKKAFDNDEGEQTGGMGSVSPAMVTKSLENRICKEIIEPTLSGLAEEGRPYVGILYLGGIFNKSENSINVIEFNARWGDPECQVVLPGLQNDYLELIQKTIEGRLNEIDLIQDNQARICVVGAARGYPDKDSSEYKNSQGKEIFGLTRAMKIPGIKIYGAGIRIEGKRFYVDGGRLFGIDAEGDKARESAYEAMECISIGGNNLHFRRDIGLA